MADTHMETRVVDRLTGKNLQNAQAGTQLQPNPLPARLKHAGAAATETPAQRSNWASKRLASHLHIIITTSAPSEAAATATCLCWDQSVENAQLRSSRGRHATPVAAPQARQAQHQRHPC